jgi:MFS family permease
MRLTVLGRLLGAQALSSIGTSISTVALVIMVGKLTGSALHMGGVLAVSTFPLIVTSWIGGAILDRFSAKRVMVLADLVRAALIFSMPFLAEVRVGFIYGVACLVGVFSAVFNPGQMKLTSELVERDQLVRVNSYLSVSRDGAELAGYLAGGALVALVGYKVAFVLDAASYVASALLLVGLPGPAPRAGPPARVADLLAQSPRVFARLWRHPGLRTNLLLAVLPGVAIMMSLPLSYALILEVFEAEDWAIGVLEGAIAAGLILGGLAISRMALRRDKNLYVLFSLILVAGCLVGIRFGDHLWLCILLMGVIGVANVGIFVPSITMYQETSAEGDKGRLLAIRGGFGQVGATAGYLLGGFVGEALGIRQGFLMGGVAVLVVSLLVYVPYRIGSSRRARTAREAVLASGASRTAAREAARAAALGDPVPSRPVSTGDAAEAWSLAVEQIELEDKR